MWYLSVKEAADLNPELIGGINTAHGLSRWAGKKKFAGGRIAWTTWLPEVLPLPKNGSSIKIGGKKVLNGKKNVDNVSILNILFKKNTLSLR